MTVVSTAPAEAELPWIRFVLDCWKPALTQQQRDSRVIQELVCTDSDLCREHSVSIEAEERLWKPVETSTEWNYRAGNTGELEQ